MSDPPVYASRYVIELVEYGYKRVILEVEATSQAHARKKADDFDPHINPIEGVAIIESVFEATDAEIASVEKWD